MLRERSGAAGRLTVTVQTFIPRVTCIDAPIKPPDMGACPFVVNQMPADKAVKRFGRRGTPGVDVPLTWAMADRKPKAYPSWLPMVGLIQYNMIAGFQCVIKIGITNGPPVSSSWFDMWGYAIALDGMCVRHGREGRAVTEDGKTSCRTFHLDVVADVLVKGGWL